MSLTAQDIIALARAGYNAEQISLINKESLSAQSTEVSTPSTQPTEPAQPTEPTQKQELSTQTTEPVMQEEPAKVAKSEVKASDPAQDPGPTMQDIMSKLAEMENRFAHRAINTDQLPAQEDRLTGETVLARIIDPNYK